MLNLAVCLLDLRCHQLLRSLSDQNRYIDSFDAYDGWHDALDLRGYNVDYDLKTAPSFFCLSHRCRPLDARDYFGWGYFP